MDFLYALQQLRESSPDFVNKIFFVISEVLVKAYILIPAIVYWCVNKVTGRWMLFSFTGGYFLNQTVKNTLCIYRPWILDSRLHVAECAEKSATGYSCPSGHTTTAALTLGTLGVWQRKKIWPAVICAVMVLLTAFARNWLGAHTPADVLWAIALSCLSMAVTYFICRLSESHSNRDWIFLISGLAIAIGITLFLEFKSYPMDKDAAGNLLADPYKMKTDCYSAAGMLTGFIAGWFLEKRFVKFEEGGKVLNRILRGTIGSVCVLAIYILIPVLMKKCDVNMTHLVKYFLMFFFITYLYPLLIKTVEDHRQKKEKN